MYNSSSVKQQRQQVTQAIKLRDVNQARHLLAQIPEEYEFIQRNRLAFLTDAIDKNDPDMLRMFFEKGISLGDSEAIVLLERAASDASLDVIKLVCAIIELHINRTNAFFTAVSRGDLEIINYLLTLGADINQVRRGEIPLGYAVLAGNVKVVKFLVEHGADI